MLLNLTRKQKNNIMFSTRFIYDSLRRRNIYNCNIKNSGGKDA